MRKKDILELKKRLKKNHCTFTKMCGCYVNSEKSILLSFKENFLNLEEEEFFKYLEIAKKVLSGTIGNNLLELNFPLNENLENERQLSLVQLKKSALKNDALLEAFYNSIIASYDYAENFLILIFHDAYDVMKKTTDNAKLDESEEVYEYVLCAICPVSLSEAGLMYSEEGNKITTRVRDWVVENPTVGFVFPAFIDRSSDVNSIIYYTKNPKEPHQELMEETLGCLPRQTISLQKDAFQSIIKGSIDADEREAEKVFMDIQENLSTMVDEYNEMYDDTDCEPINLGENEIQNLLVSSGVPEAATLKIQEAYLDSFGEDIPLAENLVDSKALKVNAQKKKEEELVKKVEFLEQKLEEVKQESLSSENPSTENINDVVLQVNPEKVPQIKSQIIDGKKCIIIPIEENEQAIINGSNDIIGNK